MNNITIRTPLDASDFDAVRSLCWAYRDFLKALDPQIAKMVQAFYPRDTYTTILERLETDHAPPHGAIRIAANGADIVGCGMAHTLEPGIAEIKRVFVLGSERGKGTGRALCQSLIDQCKTDGFHTLRMDTGKPQEAATRLYLDMGFRLRDAYYDVPEIARGHMWFFEMDL